jgi:hypothetical protein
MEMMALDMMAFKAANPSCVLEDFIRWYSPVDFQDGTSAINHDHVTSMGLFSFSSMFSVLCRVKMQFRQTVFQDGER